MDNELQVRLDFLEEVGEYFDSLEEIFLGLASSSSKLEQLDQAMRAAHSVKGGAAMMRFLRLSQVAHGIEDFLKILRARQEDMDLELENLLLRGLDCLRAICQFYREDLPIEDEWMESNVEPIFQQLHQRLGELLPEDEDLLLAQEEEVDPRIFMFDSAAEECLSNLELLIGHFHGPQIVEGLSSAAENLSELGLMIEIEPFVRLSQSILERLENVNDDEVKSLAVLGIKYWRRCQSLIMLGKTDELSNMVDLFNLEFNTDQNSDFELDSDELSQLQETIEEIELPDFEEEDSLLVNFELDENQEIEHFDLSELQEQIDKIELIENQNSKTTGDFSQISFSKDFSISQKSSSSKGNSNVRVSTELLQKINKSFGKLILERNNLNLNLKQLKTFVVLLQKRMKQLEEFNSRVREWYDKESTQESFSTSNNQINYLKSIESSDYEEMFDSLEMDRYTELHLISQEQIETVVQLKEVSQDIELSLQDMEQATNSLNYTSKDLQNKIYSTLTRPLSEIVGRFPRVVRELSVQYGKNVRLNLEGETISVEREILEILKDPLNHLIRNAFDHGIEDPQTRINQGKNPQATIWLKAIQRGKQITISIKDDGRGIDLEKIRIRAYKLGLLDENNNNISRSELLNLIFQPNFSTADEVTELSGRGVGLNVVRENLAKIQGKIEIETKLGEGTTFNINIPINLSVLRVMLLENQGMVFAVPVDTVKEIVLVQPGMNINHEEKEEIYWNELNIPLIRLEKWLSFQRIQKPFTMKDNPAIDRPLIIVVQYKQRYYGICVDRLWAEQEITIRPIMSPIPLPAGFSNTMVFGDNRIIPLIDTNSLIEWINTEPKRTEEELKANQDSSSPLPANYFETQTKTILVVDDSINVRRYLKLTLEKVGYQVEEAKDGQEAIDKIMISSLAVNGVICDIEMPRLDGYGVLSKIKAKSEFQDLPIVMLTSRSSEKHRKVAMNLGATAYFSKPYNQEELLQTLQKAI